MDGKAKVMTVDHDEVTQEFIRGAEQTLKIAQSVNAKYAVLKESSPSCGSNLIYDGTYTKNKKAGFGVTSALLQRHGIEVYSESNFQSLLDKIM